LDKIQRSPTFSRCDVPKCRGAWDCARARTSPRPRLMYSMCCVAKHAVHQSRLRRSARSGTILHWVATFVAAMNLQLQAGWWPRAPSSDAGTGTALRSHVITSSLRVTARGEGASRRWGSQHKWREDGSTRRAALKFWRPLPSPHAPKQSTNLTAVGIWMISVGQKAGKHPGQACQRPFPDQERPSFAAKDLCSFLKHRFAWPHLSHFEMAQASTGDSW
jgi:hypothetical protein